MEASLESIKCPEAAVVTLGGNNGRSSQYPGHLLGELIGTAYMTREHGDYVRPVGVYTDHGGVSVLVFDIGCYGAYTDTQCTYKDKGIVFVPYTPHLCADNGLSIQFLFDDFGDRSTGLVDTDNGCFHRQIFIISIGL